MEIQTFGKYQFPVSEVLAVRRRTGLMGFIRPGFDVLLRGGIKLLLNKDEKEQLNQAIELHQKVIGVSATIEQFRQANRPIG